MDSFAKTISIVQTISAVASVLILILSAILILRQVSIAARSLAFESILKLQSLVDSFAQDRYLLFSFVTEACILKEDQFSSTVPQKDKPCRLTALEHSKTALTEAQRTALDALSAEQIRTARKVIGKLNDLGQLLEDRLIDEAVFLSKYHIMIIRLVHAVEGVRRMIEEKEGGDFGHRILRLRKVCIDYHYRNLKHRNADVFVLLAEERVLVLKGKS